MLLKYGGEEKETLWWVSPSVHPTVKLKRRGVFWKLCSVLYWIRVLVKRKDTSTVIGLARSPTPWCQWQLWSPPLSQTQINKFCFTYPTSQIIHLSIQSPCLCSCMNPTQGKQWSYLVFAQVITHFLLMHFYQLSSLSVCLSCRLAMFHWRRK